MSSASGDRWFLDALEGKIPNSKGLRALSALAVTEAFGEQGHSVVNTAPEILAVLVDKMSDKLLGLTRANENNDPTPKVEPR